MGREPGPTALTETRVEELAETLRNGTFRHGVTLKEFGAKWGLCIQRMGELSGLAAKKVRAESMGADHVAAKGFAMLERIASEAVAGCDPKTGNTAGHLAVAVRAVDTWLTKSGVAAPTQAKVSIESQIASLTDDQLAALEAHERAKKVKAGK